LVTFARFDCGGGATGPLPREWVVEELHGDPIVWPRPKVWTRGQNGRSNAKDGALERLRCGTIQKGNLNPIPPAPEADVLPLLPPGRSKEM